MNPFHFLFRPIQSELSSIKEDLQVNKLLGGKLLSNYLKQAGRLKKIQDAEFKIYSQWGDDGIIQYLIQNIELPHHNFIEFGVEDYSEANTRFLLINNNWSGLIMDASVENMQKVKNESLYWKYDLQCKSAFITSENINSLIEESGAPEETGILHIDIDGNDYWIWKAIKRIYPIIVIVEYNAIFGANNPYTVPYNPGFNRTKYHYSNLLYGSSLLSLCDLADEKGYDFIGCNSAGNNAYFIRRDKNNYFDCLTAETGYVEAKFKEARNESGDLTYARSVEKLKLINNQKIFNTRTNTIEYFK